MTGVGGVASLDDIRALEAVSLGERDLPQTTFEALQRSVSSYADETALSFLVSASKYTEPKRWTYSEFFDQVLRAASLFRSLGIGRNDVLAFVLPNLPETHWTIWGGEAVGIVMAINPLMEAPQISELLAEANAKWVVTLALLPGVEIWERVADAVANASCVEGVLITSPEPYLPEEQRRMLAAWSKANPLHPPREDCKLLDLSTEIAKGSPAKLSFALPSPNDISSYFCTGGTTGKPKIARRTHCSEAFNAWALNMVTGDLIGPGRTVLCGLPLFHANAQIVTGLAPLMAGGSIVLATPQGFRDPEVISEFWRICEAEKVTAFSAVPTVYGALLESIPENPTHPKVGFCGAAPMPRALLTEFERRANMPVLEGYGLTEGACASTINPIAGERKVGSVGFRIPYQDLRTVRRDEGGRVHWCGQNEIGSVCISGPNVFAGYLDERQSREVFFDDPDDFGKRWLDTGDLGRLDEDGRLWLTGRQKELIIRSGHNIDPSAVEEPLSRHSAILQAAAVGYPDRKAGEVVIAFVVLADGQQTTEEELLNYARHEIHERAAWPKRIIIMDSLPTTPIGKVEKRTLSKRAVTMVIKEEATQAGIVVDELHVVDHPVLGMVANVGSSDNVRLSELLSQYTFGVDTKEPAGSRS